jgi:hypothetical protein
MSDAYNAGRAAGIREAAEVAREIADQYVGYMSRIERAILALLDSPAPAGVTVEDMPPLTDDEKTRLRSFALEMDVRSAAKLLVSDFDALLRIAGLIAQEQNRGASATNALRAALRALSGDRA